MNQVEKFNKRYGKVKADEKVIHEKSMKEKEKDQVDAQPLMKESGLKEAAMVISHEGMSLFANMFTNSIVSAVEKSVLENQKQVLQNIESTIDRVVTSRLTEVLEGLVEGLRKYEEPSENLMVTMSKLNVTSDELDELKNVYDKFMQGNAGTAVPAEDVFGYVTVSSQDTKRDIKQPMPEPKETKLVLPKKEPQTSKEKEPNKKLHREDAIEVAIEFIKQQEEPISGAVVNKYLKTVGIEPYKNPTTFMQRVQKKEPRIIKEGFGTYKYVETNFKPVI